MEIQAQARTVPQQWQQFGETLVWVELLPSRDIDHTEKAEKSLNPVGVKFGRKRNYTPQQAAGAAVMEMHLMGDGYGTIASTMGMTASIVRRIIQQQQEEAKC